MVNYVPGMGGRIGNMRLGVATALAAVAALAASPTAAGDVSRLVVSGSSGQLRAPSTMRIDLRLAQQPDPATAKVAVYVPAGYGTRIDRVPGTVIGSVLDASVDVVGAVGRATGTVVAGDPAAYTADACAPGTHLAVWLVHLTGDGLDQTIPLYVDPVLDEPERALGAVRIVACPPAQPRLLGLSLELERVFRNPTQRGTYLWRALLTPETGDAALSSAGATVESRSPVGLPAEIVVEGRYEFLSRSGVVKGRATLAGRPVRDVALTLWSGKKRWGLSRTGLVSTDSRGRFRVVRPLATTTFFRASATLAEEDVTEAGCASPVAPGGCVSATRGSAALESPPYKLVVPPAPTLRLGARGPVVRALQESLVRLRYLPPGSATGRYDDRTWHAVVAFQGWQGVPRDGAAGPRVWRELERAKRPRPWGGLRNGVEIDLTRQVLLMVRGSQVVRAVHVSTGAYGRTPRGQFRIYRKESLSWSIPFSTWMPYASYFYGGFAMHEYSSVPEYPASHGCVRVPGVEAPILYSFAGFGTPVWIR